MSLEQDRKKNKKPAWLLAQRGNRDSKNLNPLIETGRVAAWQDLEGLISEGVTSCPPPAHAAAEIIGTNQAPGEEEEEN